MSYMWQSPSQRRRALILARDRERARSKRRLHLQRVRAELKVVGEIKAATEAHVVLTDIGTEGLGLFASKPLPVGQQIALTIEYPRRFYVRARIISCQEYDVESHVLSRARHSYRVGVMFLFANAAERRQVEQYCELLRRDYFFTGAETRIAA